MWQTGACYIRVSTDDQLEYSPDAQLKAIKDYAKKNNITIIKEHIYVDEGISGKIAEKRPEFMHMIATAKQKPRPFDIILVHKFDRFARSREDSVVYKSLLKKEAGIKVVSITESIEDDKFSVILEAMLEAMAEYYSLNLADEVKKGMTEKAERGEYQSTAPFGYSMVNKQLVIVPEEAEFVRLIFQKYANKEMNMRELALYANNLSIKSHRNNMFETRSIDYIINNPVYIGKARWTPTGKVRRNYNHPDSIIKDSTHEPIISQELWEKTKLAIKETKELFPRYSKGNINKRTWLSGLVRCSSCNRTLVVNGYNYLQCNGYIKGQCKISCLVNIKFIEKLVLEKLKDTFTGKLEINIVPKTSDIESKTEYELINDSLAQINIKEERIKIAYQDGIDTIDEYKVNKEKLTSDRNKLIERLKELKEHLIENHDEKEVITKKIESVYDLLNDENIDIETKYETAHFLIEKIIYSRKEKTLQIVYK